MQLTSARHHFIPSNRIKLSSFVSPLFSSLDSNHANYSSHSRSRTWFSRSPVRSIISSHTPSAPSIHTTPRFIRSLSSSSIPPLPSSPHHHHHHAKDTLPNPLLPPPLTIQEKKIEAAANNAAAVSKVTLYGMYVNALLAVSKMSVGLASSSPALISDAAHSFSDIVTDVVTLYAYDVARKPPDWDHPFGHGKFESVGAVCVGGLLICTGFGVGFHSLTVLYDHPTGVSDLVEISAMIPAEWGAVMAGLSMIAKEGMYHLTLKAGREANSSVVIANAHHHRSDAFSSAVALIGITGGVLLDTRLLDPLAGIIVAFMVVNSGVLVANDSISDLLDSQIPNSMLVEIAHICSSVPGITMQSRGSLRGRRMGPHILLDLSITVDGNLTASSAHQLGEHARVQILTKFPEISDIRIHVDPDPREEWSGNGMVLLAPQEIVEKKVRKILKGLDCLQGVSNVMVTYNRNHEMTLKLDIILHPNLTIREANTIASEVRSVVMNKMKHISHVDVDLELSEYAVDNQLMVLPAEDQKKGVGKGLDGKEVDDYIRELRAKKFNDRLDREFD